jgi:hypothetical protein
MGCWPELARMALVRDKKGTVGRDRLLPVREPPQCRPQVTKLPLNLPEAQGSPSGLS